LVFIVPRKRNIKKHVPDSHFRDCKRGSAKIIEIMEEDKFNVFFNTETKTVNCWELSKTTYQPFFRAGEQDSHDTVGYMIDYPS
jgi:hypothetical protein